jgi:hypothetical protein
MLRPPILSLRRAASSLCSSTYSSRPPVLAPRAPASLRSRRARDSVISGRALTFPAVLIGEGAGDREERSSGLGQGSWPEAGAESCETRTLRAGADGVRRNTAGRHHGSCAKGGMTQTTLKGALHEAGHWPAKPSASRSDAQDEGLDVQSALRAERSGAERCGPICCRTHPWCNRARPCGPPAEHAGPSRRRCARPGNARAIPLIRN